MFVDVVTWCFRVLRICVGVLHDVTVLATSRRSRVGTDSVDQRAPRRDLLTLPRDGNDGIDRRFGSALRFWRRRIVSRFALPLECQETFAGSLNAGCEAIASLGLCWHRHCAGCSTALETRVRGMRATAMSCDR